MSGQLGIENPPLNPDVWQPRTAVHEAHLSTLFATGDEKAAQDAIWAFTLEKVRCRGGHQIIAYCQAIMADQSVSHDLFFDALDKMGEMLAKYGDPEPDWLERATTYYLAQRASLDGYVDTLDDEEGDAR